MSPGRQSGVLGKGPPVLEYEPETHWHAGHVGDGQTGKWSRILNATQGARVLYAARSYCEAFDYPTSEPLGSGTELSFSETGVGTSYLSEGFSEPEPWGIWTNADQAVITLPLAVPTRKALRLELDLVYAPALCSPPSEALARSYPERRAGQGSAPRSMAAQAMAPRHRSLDPQIGEH